MKESNKLTQFRGNSAHLLPTISLRNRKEILLLTPIKLYAMLYRT